MPTKIEWAQETWNPITGCTSISEGCQNCYAARMTKRNLWGYDFRPGTEHPNRWEAPSHWRKPRLIFVGSMGDIFHEAVTDAQLDRLFTTMTHPMGGASHHTYMLLTKRPERILQAPFERFAEWPNIWLGVTAENQRRADERIPILLEIPARIRFVSIEPMLGPVRIGVTGTALDWVVCGGETGPGARAMGLTWAFDLRDQCAEAGIPFFFKKVGLNKPTPKDLQIRQWPK